MTLTAGAKLGSYDVLAPIGAGGMGEVYQAHDSKLGRDVAIKVLPEGFAHDTDRLQRFQREAKTLASLNHPNIATIHGLEHANGVHFLIMELVPGETLAERVKRDGAVPVEEALVICKQIAEALEAAHERGIIHRDLKPANVKVTPEGKVKVLDFGLAKAFAGDGASEDPSNSPTLSMAATRLGVIQGTAAYMSPEQAKGKAVDKRTDIWAFGAVLYELLAGKRAFEGEDVTEILASVVKTEPEWKQLPESTPPAVRALLRRCLQKDKTLRMRDAGDARIEIQEALAAPKDTGAAPATVAAKPLWKRAAPALSALIVGAAVTGFAVWELRHPAPAPIVTRFTLRLGEGQNFTNDGRKVAISPDGTEIVYVANQRLYIRRMGELEAHVIPGSESQLDVDSPVFSPDSASIAFWSADDQTMKRIAITGGVAVTLCPASNPYDMSWIESGILFAENPGGILRVSTNGGKPETLVSLKGDEVATAPQMLPGGKAVLFTLTKVSGFGSDVDQWDNGEVVVQALGSDHRGVLVEGGSDGRYVPSGQLVYALSGVLLAVPLDVRRLEVTGGAVPVLEGVMRSPIIGIAQFGFSSNGTLAYVPGPVAASSSNNMLLALADREGHSQQPLPLQPGPYVVPRVSPDGKHVALETTDGKNSFIAIYDLGGGTAVRRLTFGGNSYHPVWSPDGKWIGFQSDREGDLAIFQKRADGTGREERLTKPDAGAAHVPNSWSPDGKTLLFESIKGGNHSLWALSLGDGKAAPFGDIQNTYPIDAAFSPDGLWVAYSSQETGKTEVFVQPFAATGAKFQIPHTLDNHAPVWSRDGKELIYVTGPYRFATAGITTQPGFAVGNAADVFHGALSNAPWYSRGFDIMPDGQHLLEVIDAGQGHTGAPSAPQIQVVLNWFEELKQRVPPGK